MPKEKDVEIAVITLADKSDNSPVHMVSEKWLKQQRKRDAAARAVIKRFHALLAASDRLREVMGEGE